LHKAAPSDEKSTPMATRTSRAVFGDITNAGDSVAALAGKKPLKSERKADDVDARDASNPQAVTEYVNDMRAAASAFYRLFFAAAARAVSAPPPFGLRRRSRVDGVGGGAGDRSGARCRDGTRCERSEHAVAATSHSRAITRTGTSTSGRRSWRRA